MLRLVAVHIPGGPYSCLKSSPFLNHCGVWAMPEGAKSWHVRPTPVGNTPICSERELSQSERCLCSAAIRTLKVKSMVTEDPADGVLAQLLRQLGDHVAARKSAKD